MNRRQNWDRTFEIKLFNYRGEKPAFQEEKEEEDCRRMKWDQEHIGPLVAGRQPPHAAPDTLPDAAPDTLPDAAPDTLPNATPDTLPDAPPLDSKSWNSFVRWLRLRK